MRKEKAGQRRDSKPVFPGSYEIFAGIVDAGGGEGDGEGWWEFRHDRHKMFWLWINEANSVVLR